MTRIVKGALLQATYTGDKESMIGKHVKYARQAAEEGAGGRLGGAFFASGRSAGFLVMVGSLETQSIHLRSGRPSAW